MLCFPNCKINLGLYVTRKREDGYHDLETVFYPVRVNDVLEAVPADAAQMHMSGLPVHGHANDNLVWKAMQLLAAKYPHKIKPLDIYLHKVIPMGAGLGGGSADGAYMLRLLNDMFRLEASDDELIDLALQLGSDCPFFIHNSPCFASGRGERMTRTPIDLSGYSIQLICPEVHVSTGAAFKMITPGPAAFDLRQLYALPIEEWKDKVVNDFEAPVFAAHPGLAAIKKQLYDQGAIYASMSGSGSAVYGIFSGGKRAVVTVTVRYSEFYTE